MQKLIKATLESIAILILTIIIYWILVNKTNLGIDLNKTIQDMMSNFNPATDGVPVEFGVIFILVAMTGGVLFLIFSIINETLFKKTIFKIIWSIVAGILIAIVPMLIVSSLYTDVYFSVRISKLYPFAIAAVIATPLVGILFTLFYRIKE